MTDETNAEGLPEGLAGLSLQDLLAMLTGGMDPEVRERREAGQPEVEIIAALTYKRAPNDKCREFFDHNGAHVLNTVKMYGADLYTNGPTIPLVEATENRKFVDYVLSGGDAPPDFDDKRLHTATYRQIAEDLGDYIDSAVKRQAAAGDEDALNRAAVHDVSEGLSVLLRGLRNLTNADEMVDIRGEEQNETE